MAHDHGVRWLALLFVACNPTAVSGELTLDSWQFSPSACSNGDTREFYGADLTSDGATVRLFQDPVVGWLLTVTKQGDPSTPDVRASWAQCTRFDASLDIDECGRCTKNDHDEDDSTITGGVVADCMLGTVHLTANLSFQNCDNPEEDQ